MEARNLSNLSEMSASDARTHFSETINRVAYGHERIVVKRHKDEVVLISVEDLALLERLEREEEDRVDATEADRILADGPERIPWEKVKGDLGL